ncbi:MAG TPA: ABC transporter ATP-binding protein [Burkholderiaceae bacterium]|nr:ABC transporter ATP-binding protein [Burkholderiaceae bacterium]
MLSVDGLQSHYGSIRALDGVSLHVGQGELVALVGANGAGKTTLLRVISGIQPASAGMVRLKGREITHLRASARVRAGICQVPEGRQVFGPLTVEDNLRLGAYTRRDPDVPSDLRAMYELFPALRERRGSPAGTLSGGQQQMLALARALMGRPELLLMDEPSLGLAPLLVQEIFAVIARLRAQGRTILLIEQNAQAALSVADRGYVLETGRIAFHGTGAELLSSAEVQRAYLGVA